MENFENEEKVKKYWDDELSYDQKCIMLEELNFWNGLVNYHYGYIPEDLKCILRTHLLNDD
jgi:hypothetical protein